MGSIVGKITGTDKAGKRAAAAMREAGDKAQYMPWDVSGSYFGDANFDYQNNTASYNLSPELTQLRDVFMNQALAGPDQAGIDDGNYIKNAGRSMFDEAYNRDISKDAGKYYTDMQSLIQPGRAQNEQRLANNLFASGRMGHGTVAHEGGGYLNPERMEYLTAMNREDNQMAFDARDKAKSEQLADMSTGLGYYGLGNDLRMQPWNDVYSLFGMGSGVESTGMKPFEMGMGLGNSALSGDSARAAMYGAGAEQMYGTGQATTGAFTNLVGKGLGAYAGGGGFGETIKTGASLFGK